MLDFGYTDNGRKLLKEGHWVYNKRTDTNCLQLINVDMVYDAEYLPICTTRKSYWKAAVAELLGYIKGYTNAQDFADLGSPTWFANANKTQAWLDNPNRKGENDMGKVYGAVAHDFGGLDLFKKVYNDLKNGYDDRGEIITFWKPDDFDKGCLRPCMYSHHFVINDGKLDLFSTQRSCDVPLGLNFNMVQVYVFLALMSHITGIPHGKAYHKIVNFHLYENQLELFEKQMERKPFLPSVKLLINPNIKTLDDVINKMTVEDFFVTGYDNYHEAIKYPFTE